MLLENMLMTHEGGTKRTPTPGNDLVALQNKQTVYVSNENYINPLRKAKHRRELLKD